MYNLNQLIIQSYKNIKQNRKIEKTYYFSITFSKTMFQYAVNLSNKLSLCNNQQDGMLNLRSISQKHYKQQKRKLNSIKNQKIQMLKLNVSILFSYVIILTIAQTTKNQKVELDLDNIEILGSKQQYRIKFVAKNGRPPYSFKYSNIPKSWTITQKYLLVPKSNSNIYEQYLIRVMVIDSSQAQYKSSIIFLSNYLHMFMDTTIYSYAAQLPRKDNGPMKFPILKSPFQQGLQQKIKFIIYQAAQDTNLHSFSNVFEKLIIPSQIQQIIQTSNIPALIKLISKVPATQLNCVQQIGYLAQISSTSIYVIQQKKNRLNQLLKNHRQKLASKQYSYPDQAEGVNRSEEIRIIEQQISKLNTSQIKQEYLKTIDKLKQTYSLYNKLQQQVQIQRSKLVSLNMEDDQIMKSLSDKSTQLQGISYKKSPTTLSTDQRKQYQSSYDAIVQTANILKSELDKRRLAIKQIEKNITKLSDLSNIKYLQGKQIQLDIQRLQSTISKNYIEQLKLRESLSFYYMDNKIIFVFNNEGYHLNLREVGGIEEIVQLQKDISVINQTIAFLNSELDALYYECYGVRQIQKSNETQLFIYTIDYGEFVNYIKKVYQVDTRYKMAQASQELQADKVTLRRINVIDSIWTEKFGQIIDIPDQKATAKYKTGHCAVFDVLSGSTGIILQVHSNLIKVQKSNSQINYVLLGACSRIEMEGKVAPQPGNLLFWRGNLISKAIYDAFFVLIL